MRRLVIVAGLLPALWVQPAGQTLGPSEPTQGEETRQVLALQQRRFAAMVQGDLVALDTILAGDLIYTHSNGRVETKAQFLATLRTGELRYEAIAAGEVSVRVYGDAAVAMGRATVKVSSQERPFTIRFTDVYVRQGGRWRQVAWQSTRVP